MHKGKWDAAKFYKQAFKATDNQEITKVELIEDEYGYGLETSSTETTNQLFFVLGDIVSPEQGLESLKIINYKDEHVL